MTLPGLQFRPFRGAADLELMAPLSNVSFAADGLDLFRTPEDMARDCAGLQHFDPQRDLLMAEAGGELVAYARCWWWPQADGTLVGSGACVVPPQWRGRGLGRTLLAWLEQRQEEIAREQPPATAYATAAMASAATSATTTAMTDAVTGATTTAMTDAMTTATTGATARAATTARTPTTTAPAAPSGVVAAACRRPTAATSTW